MADEQYTLDARSLRRTYDTVLCVESQVKNLARRLDSRKDQHPQRWLPFRNDGSSAAPAFGVLAVTGSTDGILTITQPSTTFRRLYAVNGPDEVPASSGGLCTFDSPVQVAYDTGTPSSTEGFGIRPDQWTVSKQYPHTAGPIGVLDSTNKIMLAEWSSALVSLVGKTDASHAKSASGVVSVWAGTTEADIGWNVTAYNHFAAVATTKFVGLSWINGRWELVAADCST